MGTYLTSQEKKKTPVGRGINLLSDAKLCFANTCSDILKIEALPVLADVDTDNDAIAKSENSKHELARSVNDSIKLGTTLFKFSASVKLGFLSETSNSSENAYTAFVSLCKREKQRLDPNLADKITACRNALQEGFNKALNGPDKMKPEKLFETYGTHVILEGGLGGTTSAYLAYQKQNSQTIKQISNELGLSVEDYLSFLVAHSQKETTGTMRSSSYFKSEFLGGSGLNLSSSEAYANSFYSWQKSLDDRSTWDFCYLPNEGASLLPIWQLASDAGRRNELRRAYKNAMKGLSSPLIGSDYALDEIQIFSSNKKDEYRHFLNDYNSGLRWNFIDQDLNEGSDSSKHIYLHYRTKPLSMCSQEGPIRHVALLHRMDLAHATIDNTITRNALTFCNSSASGQHNYKRIDDVPANILKSVVLNKKFIYNNIRLKTDYPDWIFGHQDYIRQVYQTLDQGKEAVVNMRNELGETVPYHVIPVNLNDGATSGSDLYLCYTRSSSLNPITAISSYLNGEYPSDEWEVVNWGGTNILGDLNMNTWKHNKSIHLITKHAALDPNSLSGSQLCSLSRLNNDLEEEAIVSTPKPSGSSGSSKGSSSGSGSKGSGELQLLLKLSFGNHKVGDPYMPIYDYGEWRTEKAQYDSGRELIYNANYSPKSRAARYIKYKKIITRLVVYKTTETLTWKNELRLTDSRGYTATYHPIDQDINLTEEQMHYYVCYTYDSHYTPITDVKIMTTDEYRAKHKEDESYGSYNSIVFSDTQASAVLYRKGNNRLMLLIKRAASFDWNDFTP